MGALAFTFGNAGATKPQAMHTEPVRENVAVHAVVRFDRYLMDVADRLSHVVTVVAVLPTRDEAESEVARLDAIREDDDRSLYFWTPTRFYPDGRGPGN
jgi:hypothetical protein